MKVLSPILVIALLAICCGDDNTSTDSSTDIDTDSDTDIDTDIDVDTDSDTDTDIDEVPGDWVTIEAGSFWMGSPDGDCPPEYPGGVECGPEMGRESDEELHYVTLTHRFEIQSTETLQDYYRAVTGWNPSFFSTAGPGEDCGLDCPVERVTWYDATAYANEISRIAGIAQCYVLTDIICWDDTKAGTDILGCANSEQRGIKSATIELNEVDSVYDCEGYRLPTESEWEYAARAGSITAFYPSEGNDGSITSLKDDSNMAQIGWDYPASEGVTHPSGEKESNAWGLCDTAGNVDEWVWDEYAESFPEGDPKNPVVDPEGPLSGGNGARVLRGGVLGLPSYYSRSAARSYQLAHGQATSTGFRLLRTLP